ncbi:LysR substrate-binding domain-containing protein [Alcaligenes sp. SDU_A2]|uniref:LysR substrate-binding domain-containing protein n=1 Tax=Alcaligenes sp. SDU_A2 TaxID=3136634 RepID=UPI00311D7F75
MPSKHITPTQPYFRHDTDVLRSRLLSLELLRTFVAVVECQGYTAAAQYLHRTQASVSQQISKLEHSIGVALFNGSRRQLQLTEHGQLLLDYAKRLLLLQHEAITQLRSDTLEGVVRIGATHVYATQILPAILARFAQRYPHIQSDLEVGIAQDMHRELGSKFDITINAYRPGETQGILLRRDPVVWAIAEHARPHLNTPVPLATLPRGSLLRQWAEDALKAAGKKWTLVQESLSIDVLKASVLAGLAVGVFQKTTIAQTPGLRTLGTEDGFPELPSSEMRLARANRELSPSARRLYDYLLEQLSP